MQGLAAGAAGQPLNPAAVQPADATAGAAGQPAGLAAPLGSTGQGVAVADPHFKGRLGGIDRRHAGPEPGAMAFAHPQHPIHPGMDHLVAERAQQGLPRQGLQQGPRKHDLAQIRARPVQPSRAGHAAVAPAQAHQGLTPGGEAALKMLPVQAMEQGQQRFNRQGRRGAGLIVTRFRSDSWALKQAERPWIGL